MDDTQLFLNGSEHSLYLLIIILRKFYNMPGLKINEDKTKALLIKANSMCHSEIRMCKEYTLDLE